MSSSGTDKVRRADPAAEPTGDYATHITASDAAALPAETVGAPDPLLSLLRPPQADGELGRLAHFAVTRLLGRGGMGAVFAADDLLVRRKVALKVMRPEFTARPEARERFLREAQTAGGLEHDHIIPVYQVAEDNGVWFIAMPLLKGEPLDARLAREGRLPIPAVLKLGRETAEGLAAAHAQGLVHRDVKPANLWLEGTGEAGGGAFRRVKILDFGLARAVREDQHLTAAGGILGTPAYMAPEQAAGEEVDHRADLFSLGAVLYHCCAGETPFSGKSPMAVLSALANKTPVPVGERNPAVPAALANLIMRLLAKAPGDRPQSAQEVAETLRGIEQDDATVTAQAPAAAAPQRRRVSVLTACLTALLALGLAAVAAVIVVKVRTPDGKETEVTAPTGSQVAVDPKGGVTVTLPGDAPAAASDDITNSIGMKLKLIQPGTFLMGSPQDEEGRFDDEGPQHEVEITRPFYLGACPVTNGQFAAFVKDDGYVTDAEKANEKGIWRSPNFLSKYDPTDNDPVVEVSWNDAMRFCQWLSKKEGKTYELPTEAEWEYACRAGTTTAYSFGDDPQSLADYAWYGGNSGRHTHPVGQKKPNRWGLYDMHGNVWQWCADWYGPYQERSVKDPKGKDRVSSRAFRGGSWDNMLRSCRSAGRNADNPVLRCNLGFRVALRVPTAQRPHPMGDQNEAVPPGTGRNGDEIANSIGMKLKLIKAGTFLMGSPQDEVGRSDNEGPQHEVEITRAFYMGAYPVTKGQFAAFVKDNSYQTDAEKDGKGGYAFNLATAQWGQKPEYNWRNPGFSQGDDHPVVEVSWNDATAFCAWLSRKEGKTYELPTEAEWEYACRAGTTTRFWCGDKDEDLKGNANIADAALKEKDPSQSDFVAWDDGYPYTSPVGAFKPNPWGLYDMGGNVWQCCADGYDKYQEISIKDPNGKESANGRVLRGGSWGNGPRSCRSANRYLDDPAYRDGSRGFRVVLRLPARTP